jgi:hypothetical protein
MDSINNNLQFKINEDLKAHPYTNISVTVPLGENFYTSAFSFPNEIYIKTIDVIITVDSLSRKSITATYEFYGKVSANSLAGVFDLKDRVRFNKQFLESKKLLKSTSLQTYTTSDDTSTIDSSITDSLSSDSTLQNNNVVTQDSAAVLQGDSTSVVDPDSAAVLQGDSTSVVDPDSAAVLQGDSTSVVDPDSAAVKIE